MLSTLRELDNKTDSLLALLSKGLPSEEARETYIAKVQELLGERDTLLQQLKPPFSNEEMEIGRRVTDKSNELAPKLEAFQQQLKTEFAKVQQSKKTVRAYEQAYAGVSADGMYYDKRN